MTKIISVTSMNLVISKVGAKHELLFNEPASDLLNFSNFIDELVQNCFQLISK